MGETRQTLCLIDISGLFWANWHATADKEVGEAFRRTVDRVHSLADGYDFTAVCCDHPPYKRKALSADYKAQRDTPDATAVEQFRRIKERLVADGMLLWSAEGYEADDIIATACFLAREDDLDVTVCSADKDLLQLVDLDVRVMSTKTGDYYEAEDVKEKFGVPPRLVGDLLALTGDAADNVRGVRGIGIKTAAKLLKDFGPPNEFGSLQDVLDAAASGDERLKPKQCQALVDATETLKVSRKLVELYTDAPIDWSELYKERKVQPLTTGPDIWSSDDMEQSDEIVDGEFEPTNPEPEAPPAVVVEKEKKHEPDKPPSMAIVPVAHSFERSLEPSDLTDAWKLSKVLHESRMWPAFGSPHAIMAALLTGRGLGLNATQSLQGIDVIKGRPALKTVTLVGLIKTSDKCQFWRMIESTPERAVFETERVGDPTPTRYEMTIEEARQAGWAANDQWRKQPATMLRYRCQSTLARIVYPDICAGLYTPEEIEDIHG
jgi:5'-3' exonuclease